MSDLPVDEKPAFDRLAPPDLTVGCPCGATLAGNNVPPLALGLFHAAHDEHRRAAAEAAAEEDRNAATPAQRPDPACESADPGRTPGTGEHRLSERGRVPTIGGDAEGDDRRPRDGLDGRPPAEDGQP